MNFLMFYAFTDELNRLQKFAGAAERAWMNEPRTAARTAAEKLDDAILNVDPRTLRTGVGGAIGGFMSSDPGARVGGALTGGALSAGAEALARKYVGQGGSTVAQLASPLTGYAGGHLYSTAKRSLLGSG